MKFCSNLSGSLVIWPDKVGFCCVRDNVPLVARSDFSLETFFSVRNALIRGLEDTEISVADYDKHGLPSGDVHPCHGCNRIVDDEENVVTQFSQWKLKNLDIIAPNGCNAKCDYCAIYMVENYPAYAPDQFPETVVEQQTLGVLVSNADVINYLYSTDIVNSESKVLFSGGEPSTHRETMLILEGVTQRGIHSTVLTNAIRFSDVIENSLADGNCKVIVNLDSGDKDSYLKIKGVDKFDQVLRNITQYINAYSGQEGDSFLELRYIIYSKNNSKCIVDRFIQCVLDLKVRHVCISLNYFEGDDKLQDLTSDTMDSLGYFIYRLNQVGVYHVRLDNVTEDLLPQLYDICLRIAKSDITSTLKGKSEFELGVYIQSLLLKTLPISFLREHFKRLIMDTMQYSDKIALFGSGGIGQVVAEIMLNNGRPPKAILDNYSNNSDYKGIPIVKPSNEILQRGVEVVLVCSSVYHKQIFQELIADSNFDGIKIIDPFTITSQIFSFQG